MKRVLFILLCICLPFVAGKSFAQRYLPGQKGIQLTLGGVDDFGSNVKHLHGNFQVGLALSRYNRNHSRWLFGADSRTVVRTCSSLPVFPLWRVMRRPTGTASCSMTGRL